LIIIIDEQDLGKTRLFQIVSRKFNRSLINCTLEISKRLLGISKSIWSEHKLISYWLQLPYEYKAIILSSSATGLSHYVVLDILLNQWELKIDRT
jgi:hypothetical protein